MAKLYASIERRETGILPLSGWLCKRICNQWEEFTNSQSIHKAKEEIYKYRYLSRWDHRGSRSLCIGGWSGLQGNPLESHLIKGCSELCPRHAEIHFLRKSFISAQARQVRMGGHACGVPWLGHEVQQLCKGVIHSEVSFTVILGCAKRGESLWSCSTCMFPAEVKRGDPLPSCFSSHCCKPVTFSQPTSCHVFCMFVLLTDDFTY